MKELSRASPSKFLRTDSYASHNFAYNLESYPCMIDSSINNIDSNNYSCKLDNFANIIDSLVASYSQHDFESSLSNQINLKLDIKMIQIKNVLNFFSNL